VTDQRYRAVLRLPQVGRLVVASSLSRLGEQMFTVAILLYVLSRFGSPVLAGAVGFAAGAPGLLLSPVAGALLDRAGPARVILIDLAASTVLVATLVVIDRAGVTGGWLVVLVTALYSLTSPLHWAGVRALLPRLVPAESLPRINAIDTAGYALVEVAGPALAGAISAVSDPVFALAAVAALYAVAATRVVLPARLSRGEPRAEGGSLWHDVVAGVEYLLRHPTLRMLAGSYSLYQFGWGVLVVAVPVSAYRALGDGHAANVATGLLWAGLGLLAGLGALLAGRMRSDGRERRMIAVGTVCSAVAVFPIAGLGGLIGLTAGLLLVGLFSGLIDVGTLTLRQRRTEPRQLGRVLAISISANLSGLPAGSLVGGVLIDRSVPLTFAVGALAVLLAAVVITVARDRPMSVRHGENTGGSRSDDPSRESP
jgi:MFS family permease